MDLETENRIAAILMKEAADLRRQAEREGVHVYLQHPKPRVRPNPRFLAATVLGVQQANKVVEVNEMWRVRQKERELDDRLKRKSIDQRSGDGSYGEGTARESSRKRHSEANEAMASFSSNRDGGGLRDEELEAFLHSRAKRGRGSVGSRMDETGPYLPRSEDSNEDLRVSEISQRRSIYGPEKPSSLKSYPSSSEETDTESSDDDRRSKKRKRAHSRSSKKKQSDKHRSKSRSKDKEKKRKKRKEEKRNRPEK